MEDELDDDDKLIAKMKDEANSLRVSSLLGPLNYNSAADTLDRAARRILELAQLCGEAYVVVAVLANDAGRFGDDDAAVEKVLDNLAEMRIVHDDALPFPSKTTVAPSS